MKKRRFGCNIIYLVNQTLSLKLLVLELFVDFELSKFQCQVYKLSMSHHVHFPLSNSKFEIHFSVIHSDVWGPSQVTSYSSYKCSVSFIDDYTRITWIYLLRKKSEATPSSKTFHKMIQTQFHTKIKVLRTNNGQEYFQYHSRLISTWKWDHTSLILQWYTSAKWSRWEEK